MTFVDLVWSHKLTSQYRLSSHVLGFVKCGMALRLSRWPCGVCGRGVGSNSIPCTSCHKWVHKKCSGIKGSMYKVIRSFICRGCSNPVISTGHTSVDIGASANLEVVESSAT